MASTTPTVTQRVDDDKETMTDFEKKLKEMIHKAFDKIKQNVHQSLEEWDTERHIKAAKQRGDKEEVQDVDSVCQMGYAGKVFDGSPERVLEEGSTDFNKSVDTWKGDMIGERGNPPGIAPIQLHTPTVTHPEFSPHITPHFNCYDEFGKGIDVGGYGEVGTDFWGSYKDGGSGGGPGHGRVRTLDIPRFDGNDPDWWVMRVESVFSSHCMPEEEMLEAVAMVLGGDALRLYQWENNRRPFRCWTDLKGIILRQYRSSTYQNFNGSYGGYGGYVGRSEFRVGESHFIESSSKVGVNEYGTTIKNSHPSSQGSELPQGFQSSSQDAFANAWDEIQNPQMPLSRGRNNLTPPDQTQFQPQLDGPPQRVLSNYSFVNRGHGGFPFHLTPLPALGLSEGEKQRIHDRSSIMARHFFADKNEDFVNARVNALLSSLDIDTDVQARAGPPGRSQEMENVWNDSQNMQNGPGGAEGWIAEYDQHRVQRGDPNVWAQSLEQLHGANGWAPEFKNEQSQIASFDQVRGASIPSLAAMEQTRVVAHTLAQNQDPKFQNSKFLQFVSKMSRGEITFEGNQVKSSGLPAPVDGATEYQQQFNGGQSRVDQFEREEFSRGPAGWVNEFTTTREQKGPVDDQWVNEFSKLHVQDWADEFGRQVGEGMIGDDSWADTYDEYLNEQATVKQQSATSKGVYVFSELNPYVGHPNPCQEGQELFHKGLLSGAVLAVEAEVLKNSDNSEGWRFLGLAHAENDDDQQTIAAMMCAQKAEPTNLEVLLALGVSHTSELEQAAALKYLYSWLRHHPKYGTIAPSELSNSLNHSDVARYFSDAAKMSPEDADLHIVLGVLYNLSREIIQRLLADCIIQRIKAKDGNNKSGYRGVPFSFTAPAADELEPRVGRTVGNVKQGVLYLANVQLQTENIEESARVPSLGASTTGFSFQEVYGGFKRTCSDVDVTEEGAICTTQKKTVFQILESADGMVNARVGKYMVWVFDPGDGKDETTMAQQFSHSHLEDKVVLGGRGNVMHWPNTAGLSTYINKQPKTGTTGLSTYINKQTKTGPWVESPRASK